MGDGGLRSPADGDIELRGRVQCPGGQHHRPDEKRDATATATGRSLRQVVPASPAVYRVEIRCAARRAAARAVGGDESRSTCAPTTRARWRATTRPRLPRRYDNGEARGWRTETSPRSKAALMSCARDGTEAAAAVGARRHEEESRTRRLRCLPERRLPRTIGLMFTSRADRPMRCRFSSGSRTASRWRRSVYLDDTPRQVVGVLR